MRLPSHTKEQLKKLGVVALYLFGSRAQGVAGPQSDFDFAVLMDTEGYQRGSDLYNRLYDILAPLCPRTLANDVIDIVFLRDAPLELQFHVIRYGVVLFDRDPRARLRFEEQTVLAYCDFQPILSLFDRALLASL